MTKYLVTTVMMSLLSLVAYTQVAGYQISASCNVNASCEPDWCEQRRGVGMIIPFVNGVYDRDTTGIGTGSLIVNEKLDGRPYFYTAFHVLDWNQNDTIDPEEQLNIDNLRISFHYQEVDCNPTSNIEPDLLAYTITGATLIAHDKTTDFAILELHERPGPFFNAYYNGWNSSDNIPESGAVIHHPRADVKKITTYDIPLDEYGTTQFEIFGKHLTGTLQSGSSGAPWLNENKLIIGSHLGANLNELTLLADICSSPGNKAYVLGIKRLNEQFNNGLDDILRPNTQITELQGSQICRVNWDFQEGNDLHTSDNVGTGTGWTQLGIRMYDGYYNATNTVSAGTDVEIQPQTEVTFESGGKVHLTAGFHAAYESSFHAKIGMCERGCVSDKSNGNQDDEIVKVFIEDQTNSINPVPESMHMEVRPNPSSSGIFMLEFSDQLNHPFIQVIDTYGRIIGEYTIDRGLFSIDLHTFPKGVYFVKLSGHEYAEVKKLLYQ